MIKVNSKYDEGLLTLFLINLNLREKRVLVYILKMNPKSFLAYFYNCG